MIAAAQWGLSIEDDVAENAQYLKQLQGFIKHFVQLKVDHFESACLKALVLFRDGVTDDQTSSRQILLLQNQTLCLIIEKCGGLRLGHLMLLLPQIKAIGNAENLQVSSKIVWNFNFYWNNFRNISSSTRLEKFSLKKSWRTFHKFN